MSSPRTPRIVLLALALVVTLALPATTVAQTEPAPATAAGPSALSPPEGGPVDSGWLDATGATFSQFTGEAPPAGAPIWPGVRLDARTTRLGGGQPVDVQILHLDPDATVTVQPTLALGNVRGLAPVAVQSGDPLQGAVAATNGGFWLREPLGEPNGLFARDGRLVSDAETQGAGPRGTVGWTADGGIVLDRVDSVESMVLPDGRTAFLDGLNRGHREFDEYAADGSDSLIAYTSDYGGPAALTQPRQPDTGVPAIPVDLVALRLSVPLWPASGTTQGTVIGISRDTPGAFTAAVGEVIVLGTGGPAVLLDDLREGDTVVVGTEIQALDPTRTPAWTAVVRAMAGGPMIVKDGRMTDPGDWVNEGFEPNVHSDVRAPRTAIGVTTEGQTLMVTADGRRPGITVGFTIAELAQYMIAIGAVDALSLDGGGSSQMVVDGVMRNVPCCDAVTRSVADSLQVSHAEPFDGTARLRGAGRVDTAAAVARYAFPGGTSSAVLAVASAFPDALAGGPLAGVLGGPLLLSAADGLPAVTASALRDLGVQRVVLLGGDGVIGPQVVADLGAMGITATRLAGGSRFDTAAAIARELRTQVQATPGRTVTRAFITAAGSFADALAAAGPGGILGMPILLSEPTRLHPATAASLAGLDEVVLVGGTSRLSEQLAEDLRGRGLIVTRLAGEGRFDTARAVNDWLAEQTTLSDRLVVATGSDFPDALAGGPLAAALRAPLMTVPSGSIDADPAAAAFFDELGHRSEVAVLGGLLALSSYQQWQLEQLTEGEPPCPLPLDSLGACPV